MRFLVYVQRLNRTKKKINHKNPLTRVSLYMIHDRYNRVLNDMYFYYNYIIVINCDRNTNFVPTLKPAWVNMTFSVQIPRRVSIYIIQMRFSVIPNAAGSSVYKRFA